MKICFLLFMLSLNTFAQVPAPKPAYPTERGSVVPGQTPPKNPSSFEQAVKKTRPYKPQPVETPIEVSVTESTEPLKRTSADNRNESFGTVMVGYQAISSWMPSKKVISYTHLFNADWSLEFEYAWSTLGFPVVGVDLGSIEEKRYSLLARYYPGNSFHFMFGPYLNKFDAQLGSDFKDGSGRELNESFRVGSAGLAVGMGNRWNFDSGFTLGIDWLRLNIPVTNIEGDEDVVDKLKESDADDVRDVINAFNKIPTFTVLGINLGYTF